MPTMGNFISRMSPGRPADDLPMAPPAETARRSCATPAIAADMTEIRGAPRCEQVVRSRPSSTLSSNETIEKVSSGNGRASDQIVDNTLVGDLKKKPARLGQLAATVVLTEIEKSSDLAGMVRKIPAVDGSQHGLVKMLERTSDLSLEDPIRTFKGGRLRMKIAEQNVRRGRPCGAVVDALRLSSDERDLMETHAALSLRTLPKVEEDILEKVRAELRPQVPDFQVDSDSDDSLGVFVASTQRAVSMLEDGIVRQGVKDLDIRESGPGAAVLRQRAAHGLAPIRERPRQFAAGLRDLKRSIHTNDARDDTAS